MAKIHAKGAYIGFAGLNVSGFTNEITITLENDQQPADTFGVAFLESYSGHAKWSADIRGWYDGGTALTNLVPLVYHSVAQGLSQNLDVGPDGSASNKPVWKGTMNPQNVSPVLPVGGMAAFGWGGPGNGSLNLTTIT